MPSCIGRALLALSACFLILLMCQHRYLDSLHQHKQQQQRPSRSLQTTVQPLKRTQWSNFVPQSPSAASRPTNRSSAAWHPRSDLSFEDGEIVGPPSQSILCVVMPVRSNSLPKAVRNVRSWSRAGGSPCTRPTSTGADLCIFHSQSFASAADVQHARDLMDALQTPIQPPTRTDLAAAQVHGGTRELPSTPALCFGAVRFLAARIPLERDVYTIYPTHNFSGPNEHFMTTCARATCADQPYTRAHVPRMPSSREAHVAATRLSGRDHSLFDASTLSLCICDCSALALGSDVASRPVSYLHRFASLGRLRASGLASYTHFQLMESDTYPYRADWLSALTTRARRRQRTDGKGGAWVQGSRSMCLNSAEIEHVNGNALYSLDKGFQGLLRKGAMLATRLRRRAESRPLRIRRRRYRCQQRTKSAAAARQQRGSSAPAARQQRASSAPAARQ